MTGFNVIYNMNTKCGKEMLYEAKEAEFLIRKWMGHTLSNSQQSLAKPELVPAMSEDTCYVVSDFAMKWMPQKKKEHSEDWYGKKGLSWQDHLCHSCGQLQTEWRGRC